MSLAKNDPTTVSVQTLAESGDTKHPFGVSITTAKGEARWQIYGQLPEGERHKDDGGEFQAVEGNPVPVGDAPEPSDAPETWLAALLARAESPQIANIDRWSQRQDSSGKPGLTITFYNTARIFVRLL
ncbi:hypothetical protein [Streptomyces noursei]|uniref:hypothetical protein n=1 Tax=Streptomyces noursei TaxID=1971 RepID=UPI0019635662|nr:hypothetical protein [Streptomyces noursei]QRX94320.1 hypothetical protein JNO44_28885 [Streptomyces noursei]